jgi:hypothetical protein
MFLDCLSFLITAMMVVLFPPGILSQNKSAVSQVTGHEDKEAYEVYSAALPMDTWYWENSRVILILGEIPPREWPIGSPRGALSGDAKFIAAFEPIFASFEAANKRAMMLQPDFQLPKPTKLVTREELDAAFQRPWGTEVGDGWEGFRHHFPSSAGYLILSGVGFNSDRTIALVYVEHRCGGLCGAARYYILQKRDGRWVQYSPEGLKSEMRGNT